MAAGLLGFPPKSLQYNFLCKFKPVFYIRQRDYSKVRAADPCHTQRSAQSFPELTRCRRVRRRCLSLLSF